MIFFNEIILTSGWNCFSAVAKSKDVTPLVRDTCYLNTFLSLGHLLFDVWIILF